MVSLCWNRTSGVRRISGSSARIWSHLLGFHLEGGLEYTEVVRPERIKAEVGV